MKNTPRLPCRVLPRASRALAGVGGRTLIPPRIRRALAGASGRALLALPPFALLSLALLPFALGLALTAPRPAAAAAERTDALAEARALYEAGEYRQAGALLRGLIEAQPDDSELHHLLGKAYGRQAEQAVFWQAMGLAKKAKRCFERAVALDGGNIAAIEDLIRYYEAAPGFLGGSQRKAGEWRARLRRLREAEAAAS